MPRRCEWVTNPDGSRSLVMFAGPAQSARCVICGARGTLLCDYPAGEGTCDRSLCDTCAVAQPPVFGQPGRVDWCPSHSLTS